ncbi:MAG: response regulator transcription factor [Christensenellales bacterium]|nr:response regulator transcription factor [Christensenellales bacterium]
MKILLIEDDVDIADFVKMELEHEGYAVQTAFDGRTGLDIALAADFGLILLDIMLPGLNGLEVLRRLRLCKQTPVILLTARDTVMDKVAGLDTGANDYVTKPFHIEELFARIRVLARADAKGDNGSVLKNADIVMDRQKRLVFRGGRHVTLTKTQFDLLEYFLMNLDIVLSREQLLGAVWRYDYAGDSNVVDVYVRYVRNRLGEPADGKLIESVRGIGYVMRSQPVEEAQ